MTGVIRILGAFALVGAVAGAACNNAPDRTDATDPATATAPQPQGSETDEARSDIGITTAVQSRYYTDEALRGDEIDVTTNNGVVTLRGTVPDETSRQQAETLARNVAGVTQVENQLQVAGAETRTAERGTTGTATETAADRVNAGWLTTQIQAKYFADADVRGRNIDVNSTSDGIVTLRGEVENEQQRQKAVEIAQNTDGATRVEDHLRVTGAVATTGTAEPPATDREAEARITTPDAWVTTKIQAKYFMDGDVRARDINVDTNNGVVTLRGAVASDAEKRQAAALARNTDGVREVQDQLTVDPAMARDDTDASRTAAEAGDRAGAAARTAGDRIEDGWITTKIQSSYFLTTDIRGRDIDVDTKDGVVTLSGIVRTEAEKKEAEQIARDTDGVARVVNNLKVVAEVR